MARSVVDKSTYHAKLRSFLIWITNYAFFPISAISVDMATCKAVFGD